MTLNRFIYKTHKWLAVGVGVFTLLWFASGVVMVLPKSFLGRPGPVPAGNFAMPDFKAITISVPQAVATVEAAKGGSVAVTDVNLRAIEGRLYYQISTAKSGPHLIDAVSGTQLEITEAYARQMAERLMSGKAAVEEASIVRKAGVEYTYGPLPVFRYVFGDPAATIVYVSPQTGEMFSSDRNGRLRGIITGTHTFDFLRALLPVRGVKLLLMFFSFVGLAMSLFGFWILWIQFQNWLARRAGRPEAA
jgi:peptidase YpeB-like protein